MARALKVVLVEALDSVLALQVEMGHSVEPQELAEEEALVDFQARRVPSDALPQRLEELETALVLRAAFRNLVLDPAAVFLGRVPPAQMGDSVELVALMDFQACRVKTHLPLVSGRPRWAIRHSAPEE